MREFIAARTWPQTFAQPSTPEVVIERARYLTDRFQVADDTAAVTIQLIKLMGDFQTSGKQIHDANIVATMLAYDFPCLLTHNVKDFKRFGEVIRIEGIDINPAIKNIACYAA